MHENNKIQNIAVLMTVYNRKEKTIACLNSLNHSLKHKQNLKVCVYITDDGSTDGTSEAIVCMNYSFDVIILRGTGTLYWNGGMRNSWQAASKNNYDGYLWLNDDVIILENLWDNLIETHNFSLEKYHTGGIYVGSTCDPTTNKFTYGGFNFINKWTLKDELILPNGLYPIECQCAHGNITFISKDVFSEMGILYEGYIHGAGDHDYTYRSYLRGFPILVLKDYAGKCVNDHKEGGYDDFFQMSFKERVDYLYSPFGFNLHNTLLFQKRCFPHRYLFVGLFGYMKAIMPKLYFKLYRKARN